MLEFNDIHKHHDNAWKTDIDIINIDFTILHNIVK